MVAPVTRSSRIFWSGHSLTDQPVPGDVAAIARSLGHELQWNRQYMSGSSIRDRTRGRDAPPGHQGWDGYRQGYSLEGEGLDVIEELRRPRTVSGGPYDALVITEIHWVMQQLLWQDSVRLLRHFHDRGIPAQAARPVQSPALALCVRRVLARRTLKRSPLAPPLRPVVRLDLDD